MNSFLEFFHLLEKGKTFRPTKRFTQGTIRYSLHKQAHASLQSGIVFSEVVKLPPNEDLNDWLAVHLVDFFNRINLIYGTVSEYCTRSTCPKMSGGSKFEYLWQDGDRFKKPTALPACEYIDNLMDWTESQINDELIFPTSSDRPFPKSFMKMCKKILQRLFRVFVHVYFHHFDRIVSISAEAHCNTCFKHFYYFVSHFKLLDGAELEPLADLVKQICKE